MEMSPLASSPAPLVPIGASSALNCGPAVAAVARGGTARTTTVPPPVPQAWPSPTNVYVDLDVDLDVDVDQDLAAPPSQVCAGSASGSGVGKYGCFAPISWPAGMGVPSSSRRNTLLGSRSDSRTRFMVSGANG